MVVIHICSAYLCKPNLRVNTTAVDGGVHSRCAHMYPFIFAERNLNCRFCYRSLVYVCFMFAVTTNQAEAGHTGRADFNIFPFLMRIRLSLLPQTFKLKLLISLFFFFSRCEAEQEHLP